jgi:hypothetical protein
VYTVSPPAHEYLQPIAGCLQIVRHRRLFFNPYITKTAIADGF